ncbi:hypothetical protein [Virgibacillus dokdonensis]|uniref:Uncharacterized protein n=1 Tax=Virgibacillus dokdonensis TaxID=302167 RepID=A0A2K9IZR7_9BACI|nr:hypothetical protein [Virgibacillus dokdonensis]AUJ25169.1 hypothetical protein A21D_02105 [Virgibacillus dokdonensis]
MKKGRYIAGSFAIVCLIALLIVSVVKYQQLSKTVEEQEKKIEMLQEENALLHDENWNLNQHRMKEVAE